MMNTLMSETMQKYDIEEAIAIELFHLGLIKDSQGETSEKYRN